MGDSNDVVCVTRYCPRCGTEIFCRSDYETHRVFYLSENMDDPTEACPACQFDLVSIPVEILLVEPERDQEKRLVGQKVQASNRLVERLVKKDPDKFVSKAAAKRVLGAVGTAISDILARGEDLRWPGLGSFKVRQRRARRGRNPQTGEALQIPARKVIRFSAAKALSERLNR
jgi:DNA-binding protein HU-beta